jgi:uncharacterized protein YjbJ (UPF0337 family)
MNWDQVEGKWAQIKGEVRLKWGKLTDDDLEVVAGSKDKFLGRIQERYGIAKEEAEQQLDHWLKTIGPDEPRKRRKAAGASEGQSQQGEGISRDVR